VATTPPQPGQVQGAGAAVTGGTLILRRFRPVAC
jgi:hypothetical protein